jgi:hypothetical protein
MLPPGENREYNVWHRTMSGARYFLGLAFVTLASSAQSPHEQSPAIEKPPVIDVSNVLNVSAQEQISSDSGKPKRMLIIGVQNVSQRKIRGYVVDVVFEKGSRRVPFAHHAQAMIMTHPGGELRYLLPGEVERSSKPIAIPLPRAGESVTFSLRLDSVEYDDGSHGGPSKLPESDHLIRFFSNLDRLTKGQSPSK